LWIEEAGKETLEPKELDEVKEINEKISKLKNNKETLRNGKKYTQAKNYIYRQTKEPLVEQLRSQLWDLQDEFSDKSLSTKLITKGEARRFIRGVGALEKQIEKAVAKETAKRNIIEKQEASINKVKNKIDDLETEISLIKIPNAGTYENLLYVVSFPL
jgi:DNA repair exonuclease SbcCD ATPase subunit